MAERRQCEHPERVDAFTAEVDACFAARRAPAVREPDAFVAELPQRWATRAKRIWSEHGAR